MILYQLPNGKTIRFNNIIDLLNMDEQEAIADNYGVDINDPFYASTLNTSVREVVEIEEDVISFEVIDISEIEELSDDVEF